MFDFCRKRRVRDMFEIITVVILFVIAFFMWLMESLTEFWFVLLGLTAIAWLLSHFLAYVVRDEDLAIKVYDLFFAGRIVTVVLGVILIVYRVLASLIFWKQKRHLAEKTSTEVFPSSGVFYLFQSGQFGNSAIRQFGDGEENVQNSKNKRDGAFFSPSPNCTILYKVLSLWKLWCFSCFF